MKKIVVSRKDLKNNLKIIRKILNSQGKDDFKNVPQIIGVVKGNGMGLDIIQYAKFLVNNGIGTLAVANTEEALLLRKIGFQEDILMLTPITKERELVFLIESGITLTISSKEQLQKIEKLIEKESVIINAHIKIDTGFGRYGFLYSDMEEILETFQMCQKVRIVGTYTHFARPMDQKFTELQFNRFLDVIAFLKANGQYPGILHCSESTAMLKYPIMNLNAVRIGSAIQGRTLVKVDGLKPVGVLKSSIQEIKTVPKGYNISYGNMYKTKRQTKIAVVPVGYLDGFNMRKDRDIFSLKENIKSVGIEFKKIFKDNRLKVMINDKEYPIIGRIGMYHCVVDITGSQDISIYDEVVFNVPPLQIHDMVRREYV